MKNRAGGYRKNLSGEAMYQSFIPSALPPEPIEERKKESFSIIMKKCIAFAILTAAIFLTSRSNTHNSMTRETSETESEKEDCTESTDTDDETSYCADDETAAPGEDKRSD